MIQKNNKLIADEGMTLTNGTCFGKVVYLAEGDSSDRWSEITEAEAAVREQEMVEAAEQMANLFDVPEGSS